jgi:ADP-ribosylglycohydrolase
MAWRFRGRNAQDVATQFLNEIYERTPDSETRRGIAQAIEIRHVESPHTAAQMLGNGSRVICPDTVPFAVWTSAKYFGKYREAIAATASVGGDIDTNCAIVGGIVALSTGWEGIPKNWQQEMEALPYAHGQGVSTSNG